MLRRYLWMLVLCGALLGVPVWVQDANVRITWPPPVYHLTGVVDVRGTVNPTNLQSYYLEVSPLGADLWLPVSLPSLTPVTDGVIAQFDTRVVADGLINCAYMSHPARFSTTVCRR